MFSHFTTHELVVLYWYNSTKDRWLSALAGQAYRWNLLTLGDWFDRKSGLAYSASWALANALNERGAWPC